MFKNKLFRTVLLAFALAGALIGCQSKTKGGEPYMNQQMIEPQGPKAIIETSMGDITVVFFPEQAPKTVENFLTHAKEGYYNGVKFHRVIQDFMVQGGDPGDGGQSIWGGTFEDEFSDSLHHFPGALSMANSTTDTNGSQFFIVHNSQPVTAGAVGDLPLEWYLNTLQRELNLAVAAGMSEGDLDILIAELNAKLQDAQVNGMPPELLQRYSPAMARYQEVGGTHHLDYKHSVFGQVIAGMDTVNAIAAVETDASDRPVKDVTIIKITIVE